MDGRAKRKKRRKDCRQNTKADKRFLFLAEEKGKELEQVFIKTINKMNFWMRILFAVRIFFGRL